ncbi:MAG: hypothetical protein E3J88_04060 [Anaerolineales bacterium]|nr:MAG: hypothetical protein E3J88_04060 [Anaerolineales bacterium]
MAASKDFIQLPCSQDLIQAGTASVIRSLVQPGGRQADTRFDRLRYEVVDKAIDLAFRRLLTDEEVPHQLVEPISFSQPDTFDVAFGGRRCVFFGMLVSQREEISKFHSDLGYLAKEKVYIRESQRPSAYRDVDVYIFAFLTGLVTRSQQELLKAVAASEPVCLLFPMPDEWTAPDEWASLGPLALKGDISEPLPVTLYGQDGKRGYLQETMKLPSRERIQLEAKFNTLSVIEPARLPEGPVGVYSPRLQETLLVYPFQWGNVWVYGMCITLVGYISQGDFNRQADRLPAGNRVVGNPRLEEEAFSLSINDLKSIKDLFSRAEKWAKKG